MIDTPYIEDDEQYKWLKTSIKQAEEKDDITKYSAMQILEYLISDCLDEKMKEERDRDRGKSMTKDIVTITEKIEIPSFITTQLGFFRHCLRETEYCKLCLVQRLTGQSGSFCNLTINFK